MRFKPYTGSQRTLHTSLSADECLRRLHDDVITPWFGSNWTGQQPFKRERMIDRDQLVYRKVNGQRFEIMLEDAHSSVRGMQWTFWGEVVAQDNQAKIEGQYRTHRFGLFNWYANLVVAGVFVVFGFLFAVLNVGSAASVWDVGAPTIIAILGCLIILWPTNDAGYQRDETYIVESLKKLLEAEEVSTHA